MPLSARNQIPARVTSINTGEAIANVTAVIKASDVILATEGY